MALNIDQARAYDAADPLGDLKSRFDLPHGIIYLDGNSLGPLPRTTAPAVADAVSRQWREGLIRSWNAEGWIDAPQRVGARIAALIGAKPHEVITADSTSVNLHKLLLAAARMQKAGDHRRGVILSEAGNFPTDVHVAAGVADQLGLRLDLAPRNDLDRRIGRDTNVLLLTHVHYKTAERFDMAALTARTRDAGAIALWDLSHSVGAVPLHLNDDGVQLAVGCGYKYLNGGPGAPAFLYVAEALQERLANPIQGWMGHEAPFAFTDAYVPADGIARFQTGTPSILGLAALEAGLAAFDGVTAERLWSKSIALFDIFHTAMERHAPELQCITPRWHEKRGSHIAYRHPQAFELCQALIAQGVIGDFRAPDVLRFGITPLYLGAEDVVRAVECLARILREESWRAPAFAMRSKVT